MGNPFHLLLTPPDGDVSRGMQWLNGRSARRFNDPHGRTGASWQGRFHSSAIGTEAHLLLAARFVVLNPCGPGCAPTPRTGRGRATAPHWDSTRPPFRPVACSRCSATGRCRTARERHAALVGGYPG